MSIDVAAIKANVNMIDLASQYTELKEVSADEYHGPCPFCGGDDRFIVLPDRFFCRAGAGHCGRKGDPITFIMEMKNVAFPEACNILAGGNLIIEGAPLKPISHSSNGHVKKVWDEAEQARQKADLLESNEKLLQGTLKGAQACLAYLEGRGITLDTIRAFKIGYRAVNLPTSEQRELAIAIPWFDQSGSLVSIKYRFLQEHTYTDLNGKEQKASKTSRQSPKDRAFGWHALRNSKTLLLIEGEINAMSVHQVTDWDVLSLGSMYMFKELPQEIIDLAEKYDQVVVWTDELEFTRAAALKLGARMMDTQQDANDLLQAGNLLTTLKPTEDELSLAELIDECPYAISGGEMVFLKEKHVKGQAEPTIIETPICSFTAKITQAIYKEDGTRLLVIEGNGRRGGPFKLEIDAFDFGNQSRLCAALEAMVGSLDPIYVDGHRHITPAIKLLSKNQKPLLRFERTGWTSEGFVIPGKQIESVDVQLHEKLAFYYDAQVNLELGQKALLSLISAIEPGDACIILSHMFTAPLAKVIGWTNERYGIFAKGITGSLKTSWNQAAMCIYGAGFIDTANLIKFGEGSTKNAMLSLAAQAGDLPILLDNYKPNTGKDAPKEFISLAHNIMEGGDRDRSSRDGKVKHNKHVSCWPIFTGEDMPDSDASTYARVLVVPFYREKGAGTNYKLVEAQALAEHLPAIGREWLDYLNTDEAKQACAAVKAKLIETRDHWIKYLSEQHKDMTITLRIATSLSINQLAFEIVCQKFNLCQFKEQHIEALKRIAAGMAISTTESTEGQRFMGGLKEALLSKRALIAPRQQAEPGLDPQRFIGWFDGDGLYLMPSITRKIVEDILGRGALNGISNQQLYTQLQQAKMISAGKDKTCKSIRIGKDTPRLLHVLPTALQGEDEEQDLLSMLGV